MSFLFIASIGLVGLIASYFLVPKNLPIPGKVDLKGITRIFTNKPLVLSFLITAFGYGGTFAAYTYLSPLLENLGFSANAVVIILVVYGVMVAIGNTVGGHWANKKPLDSLVKMFSLLILSFIFRKLKKAAGYYGTDQLLFFKLFCGNNSSKQLKQLLIRLTRKSEK